MSFQKHEQNGLVWFTADALNAVPHGFSTRRGGVSPAPWDSLNLRPSQGDGPEALWENYHRFFAALGLNESRAVLSQQTHTANIRRVTAADAGKGLLRPRDYTDVDALITDEPGLSLTVFSADCGTVLLYDPVRQAIGAVHAGWRGCAAGIVQKTVAAMCDAYGCRAENLMAALGPCIGPCCFETDSDVPEAMRAELMADAEPFITFNGTKFHVDLAGLNRQWLLRSGVLLEHIECAELCTACHPELFWSYRKMGDSRGVQAAVIALEGRA